MALVVTTARAAGRPYIHPSGSSLKTYTRRPKRGSGSQSLRKRDQLEGVSRGECKASEGHNPLGCVNAPTTPPSPLPQPTLGRHGSGACGGQARLSKQLARIDNKVRQLQGWPHGQLRAAMKPQ